MHLVVQEDVLDAVGASPDVPGGTSGATEGSVHIWNVVHTWIEIILQGIRVPSHLRA